MESYIEVLKRVNHIVAHANCPDGTASAIILRACFPEAKVTFCQYNTDLLRNLPAEPGMIFCDFTPPVDRLQEFLDVGTIVLDHHGGPAEEVTKAFEAKDLGRFSNEKGVSGAVLAFRHAYMPMMQYSLQQPLHEIESIPLVQDIKNLAETIGVLDTWHKADPRWDQAMKLAEAIRFWPWEFWEKAPVTSWPNMVGLGDVLMYKLKDSIEHTVKSAYRFTTDKGRRVVVFQGGSQKSSYAADLLENECECAIGFKYIVEDGDPKIIFSSRSRGTFSVRNLALAYGGGGHTNAAGFSQMLPKLDPYRHIEDLFRDYESIEDEWIAAVTAPDFNQRVKNKEVVPAQLWAGLYVRKWGGSHLVKNPAY